MAFEVGNNVPEGASWSAYQTRTNKLTCPTNVEILKGLNKPGCDGSDVDIDLTYAVGGAGATTTFTQNTVISGLRYYKIYINDCAGGEVSDSIDVTATTTPVVVDTSSLSASHDWVVRIYVSDSNPGTDCVCENGYQFGIASIASNPTDTITTADIVGALDVSIDVAGVKTAVADGGTQALPAASVDDVVVSKIYISNATANSLVTISSVAGSGDGSFNSPGSVGFTPLILDDATENTAWIALMDTASAGAKTFTVTITSDDAASPYNFDITLTVA